MTCPNGKNPPIPFLHHQYHTPVPIRLNCLSQVNISRPIDPFEYVLILITLYFPTYQTELMYSRNLQHLPTRVIQYIRSLIMIYQNRKSAKSQHDHTPLLAVLHTSSSIPLFTLSLHSHIYQTPQENIDASTSRIPDPQILDKDNSLTLRYESTHEYQTHKFSTKITH